MGSRFRLKINTIQTHLFAKNSDNLCRSNLIFKRCNVVSRFGRSSVVLNGNRKFRQITFRPPLRVKFSSPTVELESPPAPPISPHSGAVALSPQASSNQNSPWVLRNLVAKLSKVFLGIGICSSPLYLIPLYFRDFGTSVAAFVFASAALGVGIFLEAIKRADEA